MNKSPRSPRSLVPTVSVGMPRFESLPRESKKQDAGT